MWACDSSTAWTSDASNRQLRIDFSGELAPALVGTAIEKESLPACATYASNR